MVGNRHFCGPIVRADGQKVVSYRWPPGRIRHEKDGMAVAARGYPSRTPCCPWPRRAVAPRRRTAQAEGVPAAAETPDPQPLPDEQIARWEGIGLVRLSLETLDTRSRELVRLKFNEGLSYKEIAERTGLSIGNVGYILHHAMKTIAVELARNGVVP